MNTQSGMVNTQSGNWVKVFTMNRIGCSRTIGLGVHDKADWVFTMGRNMQRLLEAVLVALVSNCLGLLLWLKTETADAKFILLLTLTYLRTIGCVFGFWTAGLFDVSIVAVLVTQVFSLRPLSVVLEQGIKNTPNT